MNPLRKILVPFIILVGVSVFGFFGFIIFEKVSVLDAIYMVVVTLATDGISAAYKLSDMGKIVVMVLIFVGMLTVFYIAGQLIEIIVEGHLGGYRRRKRMEKNITEMKNHYIICGYGRVGHQVAMEFDAFKVPYVVIDAKAETAPELEAKGVPYIIGNVTLEENLEKAGISRAKGLIAAADSDPDNVFVTISARVMEPKLNIVARAGHADLEKKLKVAGANRVISPYFIAGKKMAALAIRPVATDFLDMVMHGQHFELEMRELKVEGGHSIAGRTLGDAHVRQKSGANITAVRTKNGEFNLQPSAETKLEAGDIMVALGTPKQLDKLEELIK